MIWHRKLTLWSKLPPNSAIGPCHAGLGSLHGVHGELAYHVLLCREDDPSDELSGCPHSPVGIGLSRLVSCTNCSVGLRQIFTRHHMEDLTQEDLYGLWRQMQLKKCLPPSVKAGWSPEAAELLNVTDPFLNFFFFCFRPEPYFFRPLNLQFLR